MPLAVPRSIVAALVAALLAGCGVAEAPIVPTTVAVPATVGTRSGLVGGSSAVQPITVPRAGVTVPARVPATRITSVPNFRDVAGQGAGLLLSDGTRMATGVVYRSGKLRPLSSADKRRLVADGLTDIYDLRTPAVAKASPDPRVQGAKRHPVNIFAVTKSAAVRPSSVTKAKDHMKAVNRAFVSNAKQRKAIAVVLRGIAGDEGPVLIHCTEGKDRTGWISALLQLTAGASEPTVVAEYLLSNSYRKALIDKEVAKVKKAKGTKAASIKKALLKVDESYLKAGLSEMKKRYGDLDGYLKQGLGLKQATIDDLRAKLRAA